MEAPAMRRGMTRRTLWDVSPVLAGVVIMLTLIAAMFLLNYVVLPELDHLSAVVAAASKHWTSRP
jgi:hypothetical protein